MTTRFLILMLSLYLSVSSVNTQNFNNGFSFYLLPDDTTSQRFLPNFAVDSIGADDFISIDAEGHFSRNGRRIRFFGTNISAQIKNKMQ